MGSQKNQNYSKSATTTYIGGHKQPRTSVKILQTSLMISVYDSRVKSQNQNPVLPVRIIFELQRQKRNYWENMHPITSDELSGYMFIQSQVELEDCFSINYIIIK